MEMHEILTPFYGHATSVSAIKNKRWWFVVTIHKLDHRDQSRTKMGIICSLFSKDTAWGPIHTERQRQCWFCRELLRMRLGSIFNYHCKRTSPDSTIVNLFYPAWASTLSLTLNLGVNTSAQDVQNSSSWKVSWWYCAAFYYDITYTITQNSIFTSFHQSWNSMSICCVNVYYCVVKSK